MTNALATLTATMSKQSVDNERLVNHITSPPPPPDRPPQDPHFERWHPSRKAISITEWINRCTERARLNRLTDDDTLAYMKLALASVSGDFEVLVFLQQQMTNAFSTLTATVTLAQCK